MKSYVLQPIGTVHTGADGAWIALDEAFLPALQGLEGFSHLQILWWFSGTDTPESRATLSESAPYRNAPEVLGAFATRSPLRPNPIALSCVGVTFLDAAQGLIGLDYLDAQDGSPVLDIKPYTPSLDRVETPQTPDWCAHWPKNVETSGDFDWAAEFTF